MSARILVTPRSITLNGHTALESLLRAGYSVDFTSPGQTPSVQELVAKLPGCVGYLAGVEPITAEVLSAARDLRVISRNGVGIDSIDTATAQQLGIRILTAYGANAQGVAELTIGFLFMLARQLALASEPLRHGQWQRGSAGRELAGRTLGLVGCGQVGRRVASLALGLGMQVVAHDPREDFALLSGGEIRFAPLVEVLEIADFVSLHCPPSADGLCILTAAHISLMKPDACLINTARYDVWAPGAVLEALECGRLAGVAMDVFDAEPPVDCRLVQHPKVVATPHLGGYTQESIDRAATMAVGNLLGFLGGHSV